MPKNGSRLDRWVMALFFLVLVLMLAAAIVGLFGNIIDLFRG